MKNNFNNSQGRSASPLPTWNAIHESPSDDDSQDDDIDMLDRNSVAPSSSRPTTARRSTVNGASSSNPGSTSMGTGNANSTTSAKTTAKTNSTMSGFLKRKDNASDQSQINKRPKLQAGSGSTSVGASGSTGAGAGTGTGAGSSKVQGLRWAHKTLANAYPESLFPSSSGSEPLSTSAGGSGSGGAADGVTSMPPPAVPKRHSISGTGTGISTASGSGSAMRQEKEGNKGGDKTASASTSASAGGSEVKGIRTVSKPRFIRTAMKMAGQWNSRSGATGAGSVASGSGSAVGRAKNVVMNNDNEEEEEMRGSRGLGLGLGLGLGSATQPAAASTSSTPAIPSSSAPVPVRARPKPMPVALGRSSFGEASTSASASTSGSKSAAASGSGSGSKSTFTLTKPKLIQTARKSTSSAKPVDSDIQIIEISSDSEDEASKSTSKTSKPPPKSTSKAVSKPIVKSAGPGTKVGNDRSSSNSTSTSSVSSRTVRPVIERKSTGAGPSGSGSASAGPSGTRGGGTGTIKAKTSTMEVEMQVEVEPEVIELSSDDGDDEAGPSTSSKPSTSISKPSTSTSKSLTKPKPKVTPEQKRARAEKEAERVALEKKIKELQAEVAAKRRREREMWRGREVVEVDSRSGSERVEDGARTGGEGGEGEGGKGEGEGGDVQMHDQDQEADGAVQQKVDKGKDKEKEKQSEPKKSEDEWNRDEDIEMDMWADVPLFLPEKSVGGEEEEDEGEMVVDKDPGDVQESALTTGEGVATGVAPVSSPAKRTPSPAKAAPSTSISTPAPATVTAQAQEQAQAPISPPKFTDVHISASASTSSPDKPPAPRSPSNPPPSTTTTKPPSTTTAKPSSPVEPPTTSSGRTILRQIAVKSTGRAMLPKMVPSSVSPPSGSGDEGSSGGSESDEEGSGGDEEGGSNSENESDEEGSSEKAVKGDERVESEPEGVPGDEVSMQVDHTTPPPASSEKVVKKQVMSPVVPRGSPSKKRQQTLAEAITLAGKSNILKQRHRHRPRRSNASSASSSSTASGKLERELLSKTLRNVGNNPDEPIDLTSDVEDVVLGAEGADEKEEEKMNDTKRDKEMDNAPTTGSSAASFTTPQVASTSTAPPRSQVGAQLLSSSRKLVNKLRQTAAAKKMRYTPSTPSSGHPSLSPPTLSPRLENATTSIDANMKSMVDAPAEEASGPSTPMQVAYSLNPISSSPHPTSSPPNPQPSPEIPMTTLDSSPVQVTPLTQAVIGIGLGVADAEEAGSSSNTTRVAPTKSADIIPPSLSRVGGTPLSSSVASRAPIAAFSSPQRAQVSSSPRSHVASPQHGASRPTSPKHGSVHSSSVVQASPHRSPANLISPRRSPFAISPKGKEIGHRRIPSAPSATQTFRSTPKLASGSPSKPASPSYSWLLSPAGSPSRAKPNDAGQQESQVRKPALPTRMPARPSGVMSMSAVPTMASVQLGTKPLETASGASPKRAGSMDTVGVSRMEGIMGAAATQGVAPITKIVEPRSEPVVEQPLGVPAIASPEMGMGDDEDTDFYVEDGMMGVPQPPPASDDDDDAMAEIQELVNASHSDEDTMDVDYDNPLPHPPVSEVTSSVGTPSSLDSSVPSRPNGFQRRVTRRSSSNQSDGLFDHTSSPDSSRRTTPEEISIAGATTSTQQHQQPFGPVAKSYGGFPLLFWPEERRNMRTYSKLAEPKYARDLPHKLQDHINAMSEHSQLFEGMRDIFEATIQENTAEDEPDAPPIKVINDVDDEPTPPWEFYYTNMMWHAEGVPPPDIENLQGCDCEGVCGSKSKTCSCLARQREVTGMHDLEWVYDKHGRLNKKTMGYPIYECNERCGCGEECRNRVVQHGRKVEVNIQKTLEKGWGVFAGEKKIPRGTFIGIYSGEIITNSEAHVRGVKYNKFGRTYLFDIDFYHLKTSKDWKSDLTVDAYHAGNFTRFLNHSCDPNCRLYACYTNEGNTKKPLLAIFAIRDIEPKEEICFSYSGDYPGEEDDEEEGDEPPGPSQESNEEDDESDDENDRIWEVCRCGSAHCRGGIFVKR